ncbi:MAPEG family protein [Variovorax sp.]|uniref:MAPEG family protein n=1 Tax=Variovorax sp. TaxID=1871043 RepID=UPI002D2690B3|nr:MAPEG family protein [Variovorax sp.]HYP85772.1 MAPEG family protein [Variovorax sp.]
MNTASLTLAYWCVLLVALLPYLTTFAAKAGQYGPRENQAPRDWATRQTGWRARLLAAAANGFEVLPLFIGVVVIAHQLGYRQSTLDLCAAAYLVLRVIYVVVYGAGFGTLRTLVWGLGLALNICILFIGK